MSDDEYGVIMIVAGTLGLIFAFKQKVLLAWVCAVAAMAAVVGTMVN